MNLKEESRARATERNREEESRRAIVRTTREGESRKEVMRTNLARSFAQPDVQESSAIVYSNIARSTSTRRTTAGLHVILSESIVDTLISGYSTAPA